MHSVCTDYYYFVHCINSMVNLTMASSDPSSGDGLRLGLEIHAQKFQTRTCDDHIQEPWPCENNCRD
jgi:hypothetical protein